MRQLRDSLSEERRGLASQNATQSLKSHVSNGKMVLSYASFQSELCLWEFNTWLCEKERLVLPLVERDQLRLFHIKNLADLRLSSWGISEPIPEKCEEINPWDVDIAFIPGIAFDKHHNRIGYGKGYYDRLLPLCKPSVITVGVGYQEQFFEHTLPIHSKDIPLKILELF